MTNEVQEMKSQSTIKHNENDIKVNNQFNLTINFGDSKNVLALLAGLYLIRRIAKRRKHKNKAKKM